MLSALSFLPIPFRRHSLGPRPAEGVLLLVAFRRQWRLPAQKQVPVLLEKKTGLGHPGSDHAEALY